MIKRPTWIVLGIFVIALGLAWTVQRNNQNEQAQATSMPESTGLFDVTAGEVERFTVEDAAGRKVVLARGEDGMWSLVEPPAEAVDLGTAEATISEALSLMVLATLETAPSEESTGLSTPDAVITIKTQDGRELTARMGSLTPTESGYYVRLDDGPVTVVSKFGLEGLLAVLDAPPVLQTPTPAAEGEPTPAP